MGLILGVVVINVGIGLFQEGKAEKVRPLLSEGSFMWALAPSDGVSANFERELLHVGPGTIPDGMRGFFREDSYMWVLTPSRMVCATTG